MNVLMVIFTAIIALATIAYVWGTIKLWRETRKVLMLNYFAHDTDLRLKFSEVRADGSILYDRRKLTRQLQRLERIFADLKEEAEREIARAEEGSKG